MSSGHIGRFFSIEPNSELLPDLVPSSGTHSTRRRVNPLIGKVLWIEESDIVVIEPKPNEIDVCTFLDDSSDPFLYLLVGIQPNRTNALGSINCLSEIAIRHFIQRGELTINVLYANSI